MRFNPETERGLTIEGIAEQCRQAISRIPSSTRPHAQVWDCQAGRWTTTDQRQSV